MVARVLAQGIQNRLVARHKAAVSAGQSVQIPSPLHQAGIVGAGAEFGVQGHQWHQVWQHIGHAIGSQSIQGHIQFGTGVDKAACASIAKTLPIQRLAQALALAWL